MTELAGSYINEADALVYFAGDPRATTFIALTGGIAWYLKRATKIIDALPLRGRKYQLDGTQDRQFPREYRDGYDRDELTGEAEVPQNVLDAVCEEALAIYEIRASPDRLQRLKLQRDGVVSVNYSGTAETFTQSPSGGVSGAAGRFHGLMSKDAYDLIAKYIARTFPII